MNKTFKISVRLLSRIALLTAVTCSLISMTACSRKFVAVDSTKPTTITLGELDRVYQDNELLLKALKECQGAR